MNTEKSVAALCKVNLDREILTWSSQEGFQSIGHLGGNWEKLQHLMADSQFFEESDLSTVSQKLRQFCTTYRGPKKDVIEEQLKKMEQIKRQFASRVQGTKVLAAHYPPKPPDFDDFLKRLDHLTRRHKRGVFPTARL